MKNLFPIYSAHPQLVYLDNAATTQKPQTVIDSTVNFYTRYNANVGRSVCFLGDEATNRYEQAREIVQNFINAKNSEEIIFTRGATESINLVANILTEGLEEGDEIILTELEHHSNLIPWQQVAKQKNLSLKFIPILKTGELDLTTFVQLLNEKTKIVAVSHLSNVLGTITDVKKIIQSTRQYKALILIDGAQAVSKLTVDVQDLDCDFYVFSGHKIYGPTGIGVLYGKKELLEKLPPYQTGGKTIDEVSLTDFTLTDVPSKYEAGTPNIVGAIGLGDAIKFVIKHSHTTFFTSDKNRTLAKILFPHEQNLTNYAQSQLLQIPEIQVLGKGGEKMGVISFVVKNIHSLDIATYLAGQNICLRSGNHCCQPLMKKLGLENTLRISLAVYNDQQDIDFFIQKLKRAIQILA